MAWGRNDLGQCNIPLILPPNGFDAIAAGGEWSLALMMDGSLAAWGYNGKLQITNLPIGNNFAAVSAGWDHGLALTKNGSLVAWGNDADGQVTNTPTGNDFVAISAGWDWNLALKSDKTLVAWGFNQFSSINVPTDAIFTGIDACAYHGLALTPIPEPTSLTLLGMGGLMLLGLGARRWKR